MRDLLLHILLVLCLPVQTVVYLFMYLPTYNWSSLSSSVRLVYLRLMRRGRDYVILIDLQIAMLRFPRVRNLHSSLHASLSLP